MADDQDKSIADLRVANENLTTGLSALEPRLEKQRSFQLNFQINNIKLNHQQSIQFLRRII
jgi:hypothetical protein